MKIRQRVLGKEHPDTINTCRNIDNVRRILLQYQHSVDSGKRAELDNYNRELETETDPRRRAELYDKIGEIHEYFDLPQNVIDADKRAELDACGKALELEKTPEDRIARYRRIGALHRDLAEPEKALAAYDAALTLISDSNTTSTMAGTVYNEAGHLRYETGDSAGALRDCREALRILRLNLEERSPVIMKTEEFILKIQGKLDEDPAHQ